MKSTEDIKRFFQKSTLSTNQDRHEAIFEKIQRAQDESKTTAPVSYRLGPRSNIMKSSITKFVAAAVIIIAVILIINHISGSPDGVSVAWSNITRRLNDVDHVHFYEIENYQNSFPSIREGWYAHGQLRSRSCGGYSSYGEYQSFDNGKTFKFFDRHNNVTVVAESDLSKYKTFFEAITKGNLSFDSSQFNNKTPEFVSSDFLIYDFEPPTRESAWIEKISVTVGRNSLMPIQIKTYFIVEKWYCVSHLLVFDYEEPEKPEEFFEPPTETRSPHGTGRVVLGGDSVEIEVSNSPGIKKAIVRLHEKFDGPVEDLLLPYRDRYMMVGSPIYFMEISFIIDAGYRSITAKRCPLWPNQGVKAALGGDNWPDGKNRNIRYTPILKPTDKENEFILELSCWLRTRYQF